MYIQILRILQDMSFLFFSCVSTYCFYQMTAAFLPVKHKRWGRVIVFFALLPIPNIPVFNQDYINITWTFILFLITVYLGFDGLWSKKLSTVLILYPLAVSFSYLRDYVLYHRWQLHQLEIYHLLLSILGYIATSIFWYIIYRALQKGVASSSGYLTRRMWALLDIISLMPLLAIFYIIITVSDDMALLASLPIIAVSLVSDLGVIYLVFDMARHARADAENENYSLQQEYYRELEHNQQEIRKLRHDMNNHLSVINTCLSQNHIEEAKEYFSKLSDTATGTNRLFCSNTLVNAVLNAKYNRAVESSIDVFFHIDLADTPGIDDIDLCCLFANTLDNAIEGCRTIRDPRDRKLEAKARCEKGYLSLQIINTYGFCLRCVDGVYRTTKTDRTNHGYGLMKVNDIVEKYHGTIEIKAEKNQFFVTMIIAVV